MADLVTDTLDEYDGGRQVTVYVPSGRPETVVYAGDGQGISKWTQILSDADLPTTMIVAVHGLSDEMSRLSEYSPVFDAERFAAHERFFVEDVRQWVQSRFGVAASVGRTALFGYSAGGELALALGLRHPDVYGAVIAGSPGGGYKPEGRLPSLLPRVFLFAGTQEPFFHENAARWANALGGANADVKFMERDVSHGTAPWRAQLPVMLAWAFGPHRPAE